MTAGNGMLKRSEQAIILGMGADEGEPIHRLTCFPNSTYFNARACR